MAEKRETVEDIIQNWRQIGTRAGTVSCWQFGMWADRLERARKQERQEWQTGLLEDMLTPEQVRANLGLLLNWPGDADAAIIVAEYMQNNERLCVIGIATVWRSAPQWVPKKGKPVYWWRGKDSGTATYDFPHSSGHFVEIDAGERGPRICDMRQVWVERVEPLTKEDAE